MINFLIWTKNRMHRLLLLLRLQGVHRQELLLWLLLLHHQEYLKLNSVVTVGKTVELLFFTQLTFPLHLFSFFYLSTIHLPCPLFFFLISIFFTFPIFIFISFRHPIFFSLLNHLFFFVLPPLFVFFPRQLVFQRIVFPKWLFAWLTQQL